MEFSIELVTSNLMNHLDPNSEQNVRRRSHIFLEHFEASSLVLDNFGFYFANLFENTVEILYYGLHLLHLFVKTRWIDYPFDNKVNFRNKLLVYFKDSVKQWPIENQILKNSFSKLLTEICKRDLVTEWPTCLKDLLHVAQNGDYIHFEIFLLYLLRLSEDVSTHKDPNISSKDKKLLSISLYDSHVTIFKFFCHLTVTFKDHFPNLVHLNLLNIFLSSLLSFFTNVSLHLILCDDRDIIHFLHNLLFFSQFRIKSVEIFIVLLNRKEFLQDFPQEIALFFYKDIFTTIFDILKEDNSEPKIISEIIVQDYLFLQKVSELISAFTTINRDLLISVEFNDIYQHSINDNCELALSCKSDLKVYFDILSLLFCHPSQYVTLLSISSLSFFLRSNIILDPAMNSKRLKMMEYLCLKLCINGCPNGNTHPACLYNMIDFSDKKEYQLFYARFIQQISNCMSAVIRDDVNFAGTFLITIFDRLIEPPFSTSPLNTQSFYLSWDMFTRYIKLFYMVVDSMGDIMSSFYTTTSYISNHLLGYQSEDFRIILYNIKALKCIVSFIKFDESNMHNILLNIVKFLQLMPEKSNFPDNTLISIHRYTLFLFQKLIKLCAPLVFPWFSHFYDLFRTLRMGFTIFNRAIFLTCLLFMNKQSNVESQIRFISIEVKSHSDLVQFELFQILCSSTSTFIHFMGYDSQFQTEQQEFLNRYNLYNSIRILLTFFDCYNHIEFIQLREICVQIIQGIYIPLLNLFRNCMNIRSSNFISLLHPHYNNFSKLSLSERLSLSSERALIDTDEIQESHFPNDISFLIFLHEANLRLLLKCFIYNQHLYKEAIVHLICENLFNISDTNLICVRYLVMHFLQSFIVFCPLEYYGCVLLPIIDDFVQKITVRLNTEWDLISCQEEILCIISTTNSNPDIELVIIVSREILRFINSTFHFEPSKSHDVLSQNVFSMQDIQEELKIVENPVSHSSSEYNTYFKSHFLQSQNSVNQLLKLSKLALTWKDSVCTHWAVEFSTLILRHHKSYQIDVSFTKEIFFVILAEIKDQGSDPNTFHKLCVMLLAIIHISYLQYTFVFDALYSLPNVPSDSLLEFRHALLNNETNHQVVLIKKILLLIIDQEQTYLL